MFQNGDRQTRSVSFTLGLFLSLSLTHTHARFYRETPPPSPITVAEHENSLPGLEEGGGIRSDHLQGWSVTRVFDNGDYTAPSIDLSHTDTESMCG